MSEKKFELGSVKERFIKLSESDISDLIIDDWEESMNIGMSERGTFSVIIEDYEPWYKGNMAREIFIYKKLQELTKDADVKSIIQKRMEEFKKNSIKD